MDLSSRARAARRHRIVRTALIVGSLSGGLAPAAQAAHSGVTVVVKHRTLMISGTARSDRIALRLRPHHPQTVQIDVGDNGSPNFQVNRHRFNAIRITTGAGTDSVRIDESHGQFTPSARTTVDGGTGRDRLVFDGASAADSFRLAPNGRNATLRHDAGTVGLTLGRVEQVDVGSLGGNHSLAVGDLRGTGVTGVSNDLATVPGGTEPGTAAEQTVVTGTPGADSVVAAGGSATTTVRGLAATVQILHANTRDGLTIAALAGNDRIDATGLRADAPKLTADAGAGNDTVLGGAGDDRFVWNPGDGSDIVQGGGGHDAMAFNGAAAARTVRAFRGRLARVVHP